MTKRIVVVSDTQIPYHAPKPLQSVINFIGHTQPDEVVHIGDLADYPQPSRWNKDTRAEFEGSVFSDSEKVKRYFLEPLREVYGGKVGVIEGNHDLRPRDYLRKYAPALAESRQFDFDVLCDFKSYEVEVLPAFYKFAPKWIMTHGHLGGISLNRIAGNTALNAARKFGVSVVMGHTHRLGLTHFSYGYDGDSTTLTGLEVGNLMDAHKASEQYLKRGTANWQLGFGVLDVDGHKVQPQEVHVDKSGKFVVDNRVFGG